MNQRAEYLLQVLEKIGSPLMAAILQAPGRGSGDETQRDAQRMAELLGRTTQASIEMSRAIDFSQQADQGDALRVALAALASGLIGSHFRHSGKVPGENDLKKMTAAMQTVLTFSDNFVPGGDVSQRMENLRPKGQPVDEAQAALQFIHSFIPVVNAVTAFPFGQPEQKLIMDVSSRIIQKAEDLRIRLFGNPGENEQKRIELSIVAALAGIYASCHEAETARLMSLTEEQRATAGLGLESIWKAFDLRVSIVEALAKGLVPPPVDVSAGGSKSPSPPPVPEPSAPPPPPAAVAPPPAQTPPQQAATPLSMFAKKPAEPPAAAAPPPPVFTPPQQATPPSSPPAQQTGSSPMSFFKKPAEKE